MKLTVKVSVTVLDTVINESNNNKYFNLTVFDPVSHEAGTLKCNEDTFNNVQVGKKNVLICEYNDKYNSFRAVSIDQGVK